ncbi:MAG: hypothetical protein QOH97_720 [Actinoplanes sp.]|jgi:hypothetical protein|nr:hypothetical protein [Actinoplanes sp.]
MSKNGPYPGPPWSGGGPADSDEPYTEPADPWGEQAGAAVPPVHPQAGWGGHPTSMPPTMDSSLGYPTYHGPEPVSGPPPAWGQPAGPPPRKRNSPIVSLVVVLGLLICGGLGTTAWLLNGRGDPAANPDGNSATTAATAGQAAPRSSSDARFVIKGQCVRNEGTADNPDMKIVPCASGTYEVLKRVDGRTTGEADAESKCNKAPGYTRWYFYDSDLDSLDFVLCMRERDN